MVVRKMIDEHIIKDGKLFYWLLPFRAVEIFEDAVSIPLPRDEGMNIKRFNDP